MKITKVSKEELEALKDKATELTDEELDKVAGGIKLCPPKCRYMDNCCFCPEEDDV